MKQARGKQRLCGVRGAVMVAVVSTFVGCNALVGIENGVLALCDDGSLMDPNGCEDASGMGGAGSGGSGVVSGSSGQGGNQPCAPPWQRRDANGTRCYLREQIARDWFASEQRCMDLGGHLVAIDSSSELALLGEWLAEDVWIGGTDVATEGVYVWSNGQPWSFETWKDGVPVDPSGNRDCVIFVTEPGSLPAFECRMCTEKHGLVCESELINP